MNVSFFFLFVCFCCPLLAVAPDRIPCVEELEVHFFSPPLVNQALNFYQVRQELWPLINNELEERSKAVPRLMIEASANMVPNPIEYPMQKRKTAELLKKVLFKLFEDVLTKNYANKAGVTTPAFNYVFEQQKDRFVHCFGPEVEQMFKERE